MEVKKLMANLVFLGLSRGKSPSKAVCRVLPKKVEIYILQCHYKLSHIINGYLKTFICILMSGSTPSIESK